MFKWQTSGITRIPSSRACSITSATSTGVYTWSDVYAPYNSYRFEYETKRKKLLSITVCDKLGKVLLSNGNDWSSTRCQWNTFNLL